MGVFLIKKKFVKKCTIEASTSCFWESLHESYDTKKTRIEKFYLQQNRKTESFRLFFSKHLDAKKKMENLGIPTCFYTHSYTLKSLSFRRLTIMLLAYTYLNHAVTFFAYFVFFLFIWVSRKKEGEKVRFVCLICSEKCWQCCQKESWTPKINNIYMILADE